VSEVDSAKLHDAFAQASLRQISLGVLFTVLSYALLTGYDALALRQLRLAVPYRRTALASFASYAMSFNLGFPLLTAGTVRYWIYGPKGVSAGKVASLTVVAGLTFWLGMGAVLGWSLLREAESVAPLARTGAGVIRAIGLAAVALVGGYLVWVSMARRSVTVQGWRLELPGLGLSLGQMLIGAGDVCAAAAVLYVLLPANAIDFSAFLAVYVSAAMLGIASHAPGGLGVFEATVLLALSGLPREPVLGALLLFRVCYYLVPFVLALACLGAYEILNRLQAASRDFRRARRAGSDRPS
jgi:uncharacterized membrane protein YbhN (UPF0104 family)